MEDPRKSDSSEMEDQPQPQGEDALIGRIGEGPRDSALSPGGRRKKPSLQTPGARAPRQIPSGPTDDRLKLPRGAMVALRKSGGLRFSSREVVVFRDGRVRLSSSGVGAQPEVAQGRRLLEDELVALYQRIAASGLGRLPTPEVAQSPDSFAYELVARIGRTARHAEFVDGAIPDTLAPIVRDLLALASEEG